uniref:Amidohydrolase family protein n=1 Tax=Phenylobacterium glaciei TaxID=2803784 RepID=A0A974S8T5_9CAUL|nr:amidohydrolase family protein [Phenylobacterium glaciei]
MIVAQGSRHSPEHIAAQIALGDRLIESSKEIQALGAFDAGDRSRALDLLGFKKQLVFATHSVALPFSASSRVSPELRYGATRAHNRHMADFCGGDDRLLGVAIIPLDEPSLAIAELDAALAAGLKAVWIPHRTPGERSPGHIDFDPFWARLAESGTPSCCMLAARPAAGQGLDEQRSRACGRLDGGGENLRSKDIAILHQGPETFLSVMLIDGVFERFPGLRGASVELARLGAVPAHPPGLGGQELDPGRQEPDPLQPQAFGDAEPADGLHPFVFEDVGVLIDQSSPELYLFSSDYPHVEGGRDPIKRFEGFLGTAARPCGTPSTPRTSCASSQAPGSWSRRAPVRASRARDWRTGCPTHWLPRTFRAVHTTAYAIGISRTLVFPCPRLFARIQVARWGPWWGRLETGDGANAQSVDVETAGEPRARTAR